MSKEITIQDFIEARIEKRKSIPLIGLRGSSPEEDNKLFRELSARKNEIQARKNGHEYLVVGCDRIVVGVEVTEDSFIPEGMVSFIIPADDYVVLRFEERYIGEFWNAICKEENLIAYGIDLGKPRYEIFTDLLQPRGITEWYFSHNK
ncbi:GyrI-like domain-containing protein [Paenibacillus puerhi]|uniref:GyrI-like domain-containing protein n=1 Tax=Paenibacillus puerhi TaxID=2692622 RepID=UPI00135C3CC8|nr:effector binding domain-containing protein [Paenibacillus puerhi]